MRLARSDKDPTVLVDSVVFLLSDGVENVDSGIGNAVLALLQDAPALASIQKRPELLGAAIEECLRLESPAQFIARVVTEDVFMYGQTVRAGNAVLLGSANRDLEAFADADRLCLEPDPQRRSHLSSGLAVDWEPWIGFTCQKSTSPLFRAGAYPASAGCAS